MPKLWRVNIPSSVGIKRSINCWNILVNPGPHQSESSGERTITYKRNSNCNFLVLFCPQAGWRQVKVTAQRRGMDYAEGGEDTDTSGQP